ncbi:MAG: antibiotic biosynthesis monooxygenase [Roseiflexaceae bacterium]
MNNIMRKDCTAMYAIIRRIKVQPQLLEELVRRTEQAFVPLLRDEPGFVEFTVAQVGQDEGLSISIFETKEAAEEGNRKAFEWAKEQLFPLAQGPAEVVGFGQILIHHKKQLEEARNSS